MGIITDATVDFLKAIRKQAEINCNANTDAQALEVKILYPNFEDIADGTTLEAGSRLNYKGVLYNVLQTHAKQGETWNPENAQSLYAKVLIPDPDVIPEWEQPNSTNGYKIGDKTTHNGKTWESLVDNNVWEPGAPGTESAWKEVTE